MNAALRLEVFKSGELLQEISLEQGQGAFADTPELWIGRDGSCGVVLDDRSISRKHAVVRMTDDGVAFEKHSQFGEFRVNGTDSEQVVLKGGEHVVLGPFEIRIRSEEVAVPESVVEVPEASNETELESVAEVELGNPEDAPVEALEFGGDFAQPDFDTPADGAELDQNNSQTRSEIDLSFGDDDGKTKVIAVPDQVKGLLLFGNGDANVTEYEIGDDEIAIGRSQKCHIVLEDKRSSRKHALIVRSGLKYSVKDLGSANGTLVNGVRVDQQELHSGDEVQIGETRFSFKLMQADYEQKQQEFIPATSPEELQSVATPLEIYATPEPVSNEDYAFGADEMAQSQGAKPSSRSLIGKALERYRAMNTRQQIIWGALVLTVIWLFLYDDTGTTQPARLNTAATQAAKREAQKALPKGQAVFEMLTPEQKSYVDTQYQLSFDLYKNREYDKTLLELEKIFALIQDYKQAREIQAFAREGKRKLELQEEERRRKEAERQAQLKLKTLVEQAGFYMEKGDYREAEALFPEIELLQPENVAVSEWRKQIIAAVEREEAQKREQERVARINQRARNDFESAKQFADRGDFYQALNAYDPILAREITDESLVTDIKNEISRVEAALVAKRDPLIEQAIEQEKNGDLAQAYKSFEAATRIDPIDQRPIEGMNRIRGALTSKAKTIYAEGVFAESYSDVETAQKRYREVLEIVPESDDYFAKASKRLKSLTVLNQVGEDVSNRGVASE